MIKLPAKLFIIKLFAQINVFKKNVAAFLCDFLYSNMIQGIHHLRKMFLAIKKQASP